MSVDLQRSISRLTLRQLRIVLAVADYGSLVAAAKHLDMTQPAISKGLQETEAILGLRMFSRTNRGVQPTLFGDVLTSHFRLIAAQLAHASDTIEDLRNGHDARIVIGALLSVCADLLPRAIARVCEKRSRISVNVTDGAIKNLLHDLRLGRLELAVGPVHEHQEHDDLAVELLTTDVACIVVNKNHPLKKKRAVTLADLKNMPWVTPPPETKLARQIDFAFREQHLTRSSHSVVSDSHTLGRTLVIDHGYAAVWSWMRARREARLGVIAVLPILLSGTQVDIGVFTRNGERFSAAAEMLLQSLREVAGELEPCPFLAN